MPRAVRTTDDFRVLLVDAEQGRATGAAEGAGAVGGGLIDRELVFTRGDPEPGRTGGDPGDVSGAVIAPAHRAVAMQTGERWQPDLEQDGAAQAGSVGSG